MYNIEFSGQFKRDYKLMKKRGADITLIRSAIEQLARDAQLPQQYRPHVLSGNLAGVWECHVLPDWLMLYEIKDCIRLVRLIRTGTHSDLFGKKRR